MADEYTPTMENLISAYAWAATDDDAEHRAADARRAIEAHDREVAARALREAADAANAASGGNDWFPLEWAGQVAGWLLRRTCRIERGES